MNKIKKLKIFGICTLTTGIILFIVAFALPLIFSALMTAVIKSSVRPSPSNVDRWKSIPGVMNLKILKKFYTFNCTNKDDVIYKGMRPIM